MNYLCFFFKKKNWNFKKKMESFKNEEEIINNDLIYISDVTFGEAVNYLHGELHKLDLTL